MLFGRECLMELAVKAIYRVKKLSDLQYISESDSQGVNIGYTGLIHCAKSVIKINVILKISTPQSFCTYAVHNKILLK
jgi:pyruvate/2-oxoacid:ferredoxin oxidoreductase beta subunit